MKKRIKIIAGLLALIGVISVVPACGKPSESKKDLSTIIGEDIVYLGGNQNNGVGIITNDHRLDVYSTTGGYAVRIVNVTNLENKGDILTEDAVAFSNKTPVTLAIKDSGENTERLYNKVYQEIYASNGNLVAVGSVETENGSRLTVKDTYKRGEQSVILSRKITVEKAGEGDEGYSSRINFLSNAPSDDGKGDYTDFDYFIPAIMYKDTELNTAGGIASSYRNKSIMVKETRTGLPMVAGRNIATGETLSICHYNPQISSTISDVETNSYYTDAGYNCGSVGIVRDPAPTLSFAYPTVEMSVVYQTNFSVAKRFHPIKKGFTTQFDLDIRADKTGDYWQMMEDTYRYHYSMQEKEIYNVNLETVYEEVIKTLDDFSYSAQTNNKELTGIPYGVFVTDGHIESGLTMEMGFVGMEISLACQLMKYGMKNDDEEMFNKGVKMADMWAEYATTDSGVVKPYIWSTGAFNPMPCYIRRMTDGMEGLLDCVLFAESIGMSKPTWAETLHNYVEFLVNKQNEDGSWYRAYDYGGNMYTSDNKYGQTPMIESTWVQAESKNSSAIPIRLLTRYYVKTKDQKYLNSAIKGGEFVANTLVPTGKFGGATCDGYDRTDRETGIFTMYAFNSLYGVTGQEKYLQLAKQAAIYSASWTITYKFKTAKDGGVEVGKNFVNNAITDGLSVISSGHSGVDNFMSYVYAEFFKLYVWTGEEFFYDFALFAQNNTKQTLNWKGQMGYASKGFVLEGTYLSEFDFLTAGDTGVWLPWSANATIEPMIIMQELFGDMDVCNVTKQDMGSLRNKLSEYYSVN